MRRLTRIWPLLVALVLAGGLGARSAVPALANHPMLSGTVSCSAGGQFVITWTVTNSESVSGTDRTMTIVQNPTTAPPIPLLPNVALIGTTITFPESGINVGDVLQPQGGTGPSSETGTTTLPGNTTGTVILYVTGLFIEPDGTTLSPVTPNPDTESTWVTLSGGCGGTTQTIAGHIYDCTGGTATTTEVPGGTLGTSGVPTQPNPLAPTTVAAGTYTMSAGAPTGYQFVQCGSSATITSPSSATESVTVPAGGAGVGIFYVTKTTACSTTTSIASNFNGTGIAFNPVSGENNYIWFTSVLKLSGASGNQPVTVSTSNATITFTANGTTYTLSVPNAQVTFSPSATMATTTFNTSTMTWVTTTPFGTSGNTFLSGLTFKVPVGGLPGGINPVTWSGTIASGTPGVSINWQWAAAVYNNFTTDYNALGVKPTDDNQASMYKNSDHAGTPESYTIPGILPGGARGGGGSNWTGSLTGTATVKPQCS